MADSGDPILELFYVFNKQSVQYLVVGGTAVSFYGDFRKSKVSSGAEVDKPDLDFWYNPTYENYFKLLNAMEELGQEVTKHREEAAPDPRKSFFRYELDDYTLDLLPSIQVPIKFWEAAARKTVVEREGVEIPFISLEDLLQDKQALGRQKDLDDIENLRRNNPPQVR